MTVIVHGTTGSGIDSNEQVDEIIQIDDNEKEMEGNDEALVSGQDGSDDQLPEGYETKTSEEGTKEKVHEKKEDDFDNELSLNVKNVNDKNDIVINVDVHKCNDTQVEHFVTKDNVEISDNETENESENLESMETDYESFDENSDNEEHVSGCVDSATDVDMKSMDILQQPLFLNPDIKVQGKIALWQHFIVAGISTENVQAISVTRAIEHVTGLNSVLAVVKDDTSSYDVTLDSKSNATKILSGFEILDKDYESVVHVDNIVQHETRKRKIANSDDNCSESDENIDVDVKDDDEVDISAPSVSVVEEEKKMKKLVKKLNVTEIALF
ncbi:uncharacterized protein [Mytilus edulis]|uniref:uncharacterized protein n=1 Tax=Mytilus edulis TaxID=6550 RepID=UPI0039EFC894